MQTNIHKPLNIVGVNTTIEWILDKKDAHHGITAYWAKSWIFQLTAFAVVMDQSWWSITE